MDEKLTDEVGAEHRLDAEAANRLAQQINDVAEGRVPTENPSEIQTSERVGEGSGPSLDAATSGYQPLEAEERERRAGVFPPDVNPDVEIGGSAEERGALSEEYRRQR